jgi:hypothetical protein
LRLEATTSHKCRNSKVDSPKPPNCHTPGPKSKTKKMSYLPTPSPIPKRHLNQKTITAKDRTFGKWPGTKDLHKNMQPAQLIVWQSLWTDMENLNVKMQWR